MLAVSYGFALPIEGPSIRYLATGDRLGGVMAPRPNGWLMGALVMAVILVLSSLVAVAWRASLVATPYFRTAGLVLAAAYIIWYELAGPFDVERRLTFRHLARLLVDARRSFTVSNEGRSNLFSR